jgi:hypothetical protein
MNEITGNLLEKCEILKIIKIVNSSKIISNETAS